MIIVKKSEVGWSCDWLLQFIGCWCFTSWQHLWSHQGEYPLVTVCTHNAWKIKPREPWSTLFWHWAKQSWSYHINAQCHGCNEIGNTVPRVGPEPTSLAFWASVLPLHHVGFTDVTTIPTPTFLCRSLPQRSVQTTTPSVSSIWFLYYFCMEKAGNTTWK